MTWLCFRGVLLSIAALFVCCIVVDFSVICFEIAVAIFAMPLTAVSAAEKTFVLFIFEVVIFFFGFWFECCVDSVTFPNPNIALHDADGIVAKAIRFFGDAFALVAMKRVCAWRLFESLCFLCRCCNVRCCTWWWRWYRSNEDLIFAYEAAVVAMQRVCVGLFCNCFVWCAISS